MKRYLWLTMLFAALAACAGTPRLSDSQKYALYRDHAGEPVKSFRYFGNINGWTPLDETSLVVWTRPTQAYLLELTGPCRDLDYAPAITLTNMMGEVSARFDKVLIHGGGSGQAMPCWIEEIRPVDVKAVRQAERDLRQAATAERTASEPESVGMANPASVNCAKLGGVSIAKTAADGGQSADCKLPNGQQCDEWTLFREGKCPVAPKTK
jgi:putative hemolysin